MVYSESFQLLEAWIWQKGTCFLTIDLRASKQHHPSEFFNTTKTKLPPFNRNAKIFSSATFAVPRNGTKLVGGAIGQIAQIPVLKPGGWKILWLPPHEIKRWVRCDLIPCSCWLIRNWEAVPTVGKLRAFQGASEKLKMSDFLIWERGLSEAPPACPSMRP